MNSKGGLMFDAIEREVENWPGVTVELVEGGKHPKAKFLFNGMMLSRPFSSTSTEGGMAVHQMLGDMRRIMKQLGATRDKPEPSKEEDEAPYRKPNGGADKREMPRTSEPAKPEPTLKEKAEAAGLKVPEIVNVPDDDQTPEEVDRETKVAELEALIASISDGIYFGLAAEIYHGVNALGGGALCDLNVSPATFWEGSWLDPRRPQLDEEQTNAQLLGKAYHCARLEPELFEVLFCRKPDKADYPAKGLLTSDAAVKAALKELGEQQTVTGESNEDRAERLIDAGYKGTILPLEMARWQREIAQRSPQPTPIKAEFWDDIIVDMERIRDIPEVTEKLTDGAAEVSVFWTDENGIRCKARFDYLKPEYFSDLKTYANSNGKNVHQAISYAIQNNRYYLIAAHYRDAAEAIRTGGLAIRGPSDNSQRELIEAIQLREFPLGCWFIFQEKGGIPNLFAKEFKFISAGAVREEEIKIFLQSDNPTEREMARQALGAKTQIYKKGLWEVALAKQIFMTYSQVFEPGQPWRPIDPEGTIDDADFHPRFLESR